jgi:hypothetical protein
MTRSLLILAGALFATTSATGSCDAPRSITTKDGDALDVYADYATDEPLNEPCYADDSCDGYATCCVKKDTCISVHGGMVSSYARNYEGGCYSNSSSKRAFNTDAGCAEGQVGECMEIFLEEIQGSTTKNAATAKATLPADTIKRLRGKDSCECPAGEKWEGEACTCDPEYVSPYCNARYDPNKCQGDLTRCDKKCTLPEVVEIPLSGEDLAVFPAASWTGAPIDPYNEPCYADDSCDGYVTCCVTYGTCVSKHGGTVSSLAKNYVGGCYSNSSSKGAFNTAAGCVQQGECNERLLEDVHGATTKDAANNKITLPHVTLARQKKADTCACPWGEKKAGDLCVCDPEWVDPTCNSRYYDCSKDLTRCNAKMNITFVAAGDVSDPAYQGAALVTLCGKIAVAAGLSASSATCKVEAASVKITAELSIATTTTVQAVSDLLYTAMGSTSAASSLLGVTVESAPKMTVNGATQAPSAGATAPPSGDSGLSTGALVGIIIGALAGLVAIGLGLYCVMMKKPTVGAKSAV